MINRKNYNQNWYNTFRVDENSQANRLPAYIEVCDGKPKNRHTVSLLTVGVNKC